MHYALQRDTSKAEVMMVYMMELLLVSTAFKILSCITAGYVDCVLPSLGLFLAHERKNFDMHMQANCGGVEDCLERALDKGF
ncbi:hypothetical protein TNIN_95981 [Trichonephila inaurata madagascariensis]|uniref:Uncharacterized protein n=1 Tax=Trichonephila inaurata madagascariensis TaxID=2747483 RepID=A0A8X6X8E0_9ARAC|nr:hypothetical protein TNIN_95981 [Trichonephila inaurata madagascariensis]